eukprot:759809-Hanusia_phi.AAC.7
MGIPVCELSIQSAPTHITSPKIEGNKATYQNSSPARAKADTSWTGQDAVREEGMREGMRGGDDFLLLAQALYFLPTARCFLPFRCCPWRTQGGRGAKGTMS